MGIDELVGERRARLAEAEDIAARFPDAAYARAWPGYGTVIASGLVKNCPNLSIDATSHPKSHEISLVLRCSSGCADVLQQNPLDSSRVLLAPIDKVFARLSDEHRAALVAAIVAVGSEQ
jgi:hypothetical protein